MSGLRVIGLIKNFTRSPTASHLQKRWSSGTAWHYRSVSEPPKWAQRGATATAVLAYWWFYWNLWHDWPHLLGMHNGHFLKEPSEYTDEELGIPPDDA
ncbi:uncharacterized protein LOC106647386 [Copidosoma floridanum]|uniref:uncharacterized protein LOC106647386 n=1 Tax=Copidosoma floridanum TaxID=29053 RepID=UPI0006C975A2|nr:uncharacterized protein LOC106647386 [Copidosoma floridanum]